MGLERSLTVQPSETELKTMHQIAAGALDAGFIGISIDMFPWHRMSGEWRGCTIPSQADRFPVQELPTVTKETGVFYWESPIATK